MIYLCSNTPSAGVVHLKLCQIDFFKFNLDLKEFDALIISSKNSIFALKQNNIKANENLQIFAIGEASAKVAKDYGFKKIFISQNSHGDGFARQILNKLKNKKTLFLRAKEQVSNIAGILRLGGVNLKEQIAYENKILKCEKMDFEKNSIFIFTSPKNVKAFLQNFTWEENFKAIAIGHSTANALKEFCEPIISQEQSIIKCIKLAKNLL